MMVEAAKTIKEVKITSGEDLARVLRHPDPGMRTVVLRAIADRPDQAMSVSKFQGRDLIDELKLLCEETVGTSDRMSYVYTLLNLDDERCRTFAKEEFLKTDHTSLTLLAASQIAKLPQMEIIEFLSPIVMMADRPTHARAAANLLAGYDKLAPAAQLRVAILSDHGIMPPPLDKESLSAWLADLEGPYPKATRNALKQLGQEVFSFLLSEWDALPQEIKIWALDWSGGEGTVEAVSVIKAVLLQDESDDVLTSALSSLQDITGDNEINMMVIPLYDHQAESVRAAAIMAGKGWADWSEEIFTESSDDVRMAMVSRISEFGTEADVELLISLLEDNNWRVRASATEALVALAPASLSALRKSLESGLEHVRLATAKALYSLDKEDWIEEGLAKFME